MYRRQSENSCLHASSPPLLSSPLLSPPRRRADIIPSILSLFLDGLCYDKFNWGLSSHNISVNIRLARSVSKRKWPYCMFFSQEHNVCLCKWIARRHFDTPLCVSVSMHKNLVLILLCIHCIPHNSDIQSTATAGPEYSLEITKRGNIILCWQSERYGSCWKILKNDGCSEGDRDHFCESAPYCFLSHSVVTE